MANKRTYFETTKKKNKKLLFFDKKMCDLQLFFE